MVGLRKLRPIEVLDKDDVTNIHLNSLELLEKMGVKVFSKEALTILEESGADIDHKKQTAWIPPYLVDEALRKAPKSFKLCARNPENDVRLDGKHIYCATDSKALSTIDLETGERRPPIKDDVAKTALIIDALKGADLYHPLALPLDFPKHTQILHEYDAALNNTQKHVTSSPILPEDAIYLTKMAAAVAGGLQELRKRPIISAAACMMSPLILPLDQTDAALEFSKQGLPMVAMTMPLTGATSPITLAGSVLVGNAQVLGINTVIQMKYPGAPVIYGSFAMSMEVRTGAFAASFPEATMVTVGHIQMARHYGLPNLGGGTVGSSKIPDEQAAYEKALCGLMCMQAGGDICGTIGLLENYTVLSYEQLLIDYEMYDIMLRLVQGIDVNEDTMALDTIHKVGAEGHFLAEKHTLEHTKDVWMPMLTDPSPYGRWKDKGAKSVVDVAKEKVKEILATHKPTPLDKDIKKKLAEIIKEGEKVIPH